MRSSVTTLVDLIAPLSLDAFKRLLGERKLTLVRASDPGRYTGLLDWEMLLGMIERGEHPRGFGDVRLAKESINVHPDLWSVTSKIDNTTKIDVAKLESYMADGCSLIVTPIDPHETTLAALCDNIRETVRERIKMGVIVNTGRGGAFKLHYDPEDLLILQVEGTKRWRIFGPPVSNPVVGMPKPPPPPETTPIFDEILQPGDFLFLPAGNWHHCKNGPARSLQLGIFFTPPTGWHTLKALTSQVLSEERFRTPLTRLGGSELAAIEAHIKSSLAERFDQLNIDQFLTKWSNPKQAAGYVPDRGSEMALNEFLADWNKKADQ